MHTRSLEHTYTFATIHSLVNCSRLSFIVWQHVQIYLYTCFTLAERITLNIYTIFERQKHPYGHSSAFYIENDDFAPCLCNVKLNVTHSHIHSHTIVFTQRANRNKTTYKSMKNSKHVPFLLVQRLQFKRHTHLHSTIYSICIRLQVYCDNSVGKIKKRQLHQLKDNLPSHNKQVSANIKQCVAEACSIYSFKRKV